jgi:hypothetical protein
VVSLGIDIRYDKMLGNSRNIEKMVLHLWKAGPQTIQLQRQLEAMANDE